MKVLIVDDALFMRTSIKNMLEKQGIKVIGESPDGKDALIKYQELRPDLVTLDITMPEMDGIETLKRLKQLDVNAKVLMITAMGHERSVKEAILAGAKGFVVKPFTEEVLIKALKSFK